jgi:hypothetical protein
MVPRDRSCGILDSAISIINEEHCADSRCVGEVTEYQTGDPARRDGRMKALQVRKKQSSKSHKHSRPNAVCLEGALRSRKEIHTFG